MKIIGESEPYIIELTPKESMLAITSLIGDDPLLRVLRQHVIDGQDEWTDQTLSDSDPALEGYKKRSMAIAVNGGSDEEQIRMRNLDDDDIRRFGTNLLKCVWPQFAAFEDGVAPEIASEEALRKIYEDLLVSTAWGYAEADDDTLNPEAEKAIVDSDAKARMDNIKTIMLMTSRIIDFFDNEP